MQSLSLTLAKQLIALPSITPHDANCQNIIITHLQALGFSIEQFDYQGVSNLWARLGNNEPLFVFAGHTDVVPTGPVQEWLFPPFTPTEHDGYLYGRGAADMKGGLAAMLAATQQFLANNASFNGSIGFLITSAEEGPGELGTPKILERLSARHEKITWCLIGEPTSDKTLGDMIKIGRRGSLTGRLIIYGKQGHIAYPHLADNPIHKASPVLAKLSQLTWDKGNEYFQPTSLQIANIQAGTGASNVIPGELIAQFNLRYSPEITAEYIKQQVHELLEQHQLKYQLEWHHSGLPFYSKPAELVRACQQVIQEVLDLAPELSTSGGTSDGRFIAQTGCQVVELGLLNKTIHQVNERIKISDLTELCDIYRQILQHLLV
jgi:succinyl-diaminopimelate desuccinylase